MTYAKGERQPADLRVEPGEELWKICVSLLGLLMHHFQTLICYRVYFFRYLTKTPHPYTTVHHTLLTSFFLTSFKPWFCSIITQHTVWNWHILRAWTGESLPNLCLNPSTVWRAENMPRLPPITSRWCGDPPLGSKRSLWIVEEFSSFPQRSPLSLSARHSPRLEL